MYRAHAISRVVGTELCVFSYFDVVALACALLL